MNILVCIKQVPDTTEIRMDSKTNTLIRAGVPSTVNPFDKYALEAAVQLREALGGTVTAMTMGPAQAAQALRECYALGADRMVLVSDRCFGGADTYATSYTLAQAVRALGGFDLILCGRQAIDGDTAQVGPMLAEHLGLPQLTCACAITIEDGAIRIRQEGERAYRVLRAPLPLSPSPAKMWRWYLRCISVQYWLLPRRTMLPPLPPSPPSGPPNSTNFSRRKWREPAPPLPERPNIFT